MELTATLAHREKDHVDRKAMNDPMLNAPSSGEAPLNKEEQAFLQMFLQLPPHELVQCLQVLQHWVQAPGSRKAIALKLLNAGLTGKDVARLCGLSDRQLRRYAEYRALAQLLKQSDAPPRGTKGIDGGVEAWNQEERNVRLRKFRR
jgi:hypothetical protein